MNKHAEFGDELEPTAIQRAEAGDSRLMILLLKRFKPIEYSDKSERHTYQHDPVEILEEAKGRARAKVKAQRVKSQISTIWLSPGALRLPSLSRLAGFSGERGVQFGTNTP